MRKQWREVMRNMMKENKLKSGLKGRTTWREGEKRMEGRKKHGGDKDGLMILRVDVSGDEQKSNNMWLGEGAEETMGGGEGKTKHSVKVELRTRGEGRDGRKNWKVG